MLISRLGRVLAFSTALLGALLLAGGLTHASKPEWTSGDRDMALSGQWMDVGSMMLSAGLMAGVPTDISRLAARSRGTDAGTA